jgi:hypothetical protein
MPEIPKTLRVRSLLTDTLPYEVPVIFSNDKLHAALSATMPAQIQRLWDKIRAGKKTYTIPYNYDIAKDDNRSTILSVVHPRIQEEMAEFYEAHNASLLSHCSNGRISLRRPISLASPYVASESVDEEGKLRLGVAQLLVDEDQPDVSHIPSYFAYGKYNLLGKFINSREFIRLEGRYLRYRTLDISKCFYNIYSHTISWAVKEKIIAKEYKSSYTFESKFDKLMQLANYNETNGIVVGPEFSRIFAEIILQRIDETVVENLKSEGFRFNVDYNIHRYVDDYFVFSNATETLDKIDGEIRKQLEFYKLYVNDKKVETFVRPFVSKLSLARQEVGALLRSIRTTLHELRKAQEPAEARRHHRHLKALMAEIRLVVSKYEIAFANISGWVMSRLKRLSRVAMLSMRGELPDGMHSLIGDVVVTILEQAFYICAIDIRVRSTYSIAQLCLSLREDFSLFAEEQQDLISHVIMDQCLAILRAFRAREGEKFGCKDSVEVFNLLIVGSLFVGTEFLRSSDVQDILKAFSKRTSISYFAFISLKFCYLKDQLRFAPELTTLNSLVETRITNPDVDFLRDTEEFLLLCDWISSPDLTPKAKCDVLNRIFGTEVFGQAATLELGKWAGFVDWSGLSVYHLLAKKELRPVYSWG